MRRPTQPLDNLAAIVIIGLAVWRLGHLLAEENGPSHVMLKMRKRIGINHDEDGKPTDWPETGGLAEWLMCPYCRSVLLSAVMTAGWLLYPPIVMAFAAMTIALWYERHHG